MRISKYFLLPVVIALFVNAIHNKKNTSNDIEINAEKLASYDQKDIKPIDYNFPYVKKNFTAFKEAVAFKESRGKYQIVNDFGYLGKYQFGKSTLRKLKVNNTDDFLTNPELQEQAFIAYCQLNKWILRKEIRNSVGKEINGVIVTESGILAAAHLGGAGSVKNYLRSNGKINFSDAYGSKISSYLKKFAGYDVANIYANKNATV